MKDTENLKLKVWEQTDALHAADFNHNFTAIDEALHAAELRGLKLYTGSYTGDGGSGTRTIPLPVEPKLMVLVGYYGTPGNFLYQDIDFYSNGRWVALNSTGCAWFDNSSSEYPKIQGKNLILNGYMHNASGYEEQYLILA